MHACCCCCAHADSALVVQEPAATPSAAQHPMHGRALEPLPGPGEPAACSCAVLSVSACTAALPHSKTWASRSLHQNGAWTHSALLTRRTPGGRLSDVAEGAEEGLPAVEGHLDDMLPQDDLPPLDPDGAEPGQLNVSPVWSGRSSSLQLCHALHAWLHPRHSAWVYKSA